MKNKLIFRVFGALASSLIILSVFMPFTNVSTISIWDMYNSPEMMYLPIMIMVFGGIGLIFFSLNIKTEFAYASSGAIIFYAVMQLFKAIYDETLNNLSIGFYFLAIGGAIIGLMAFICNIRGKQKRTEPIQNSEAVSGNQIDMPLMNAPVVNNVSPVEPVEQPVQVNIQPQIEPSRVVQEPQTPEIKPVIVEQSQNEQINNVNSVPQNLNQPIPEIVNHDIIQNSVNTVSTNPQPIPNTVSQFSGTPIPNVEPQPNPTPLNNQELVASNPVVRDFTMQQPQVNSATTSQPSTQNMQGLDIFGNFN